MLEFHFTWLEPPITTQQGKGCPMTFFRSLGSEVKEDQSLVRCSRPLFHFSPLLNCLFGEVPIPGLTRESEVYYTGRPLSLYTSALGYSLPHKASGINHCLKDTSLGPQDHEEDSNKAPLKC